MASIFQTALAAMARVLKAPLFLPAGLGAAAVAVVAEPGSGVRSSRYPTLVFKKMPTSADLLMGLGASTTGMVAK
jgi:hypothetical protein